MTAIEWQRSHSEGQSTGNESQHGIVYAPAEVNQAYQNQGIEDHLRIMYAQKAADVEFELQTVTETHSGTRRMKRIEYKVTAIRGGVRTPVYKVAINVANDRNPGIYLDSAEPGADVDQFLRPLPRRNAGTNPIVKSRTQVRGSITVRTATAISKGVGSVLIGIAGSKI
jgi:hypothetical protein